MSRKDAYIQNRNGSNSNATGKIYNESVLSYYLGVYPVILWNQFEYIFQTGLILWKKIQVQFYLWRNCFSRNFANPDFVKILLFMDTIICALLIQQFTNVFGLF